MIEPSPESDFKSGCIHLFSHSNQPHRRFLRLSKPAAGSSFRVRGAARVLRWAAAALLPSARLWLRGGCCDLLLLQVAGQGLQVLVTS